MQVVQRWLQIKTRKQKHKTKLSFFFFSSFFISFRIVQFINNLYIRVSEENPIKKALLCFQSRKWVSSQEKKLSHFSFYSNFSSSFSVPTTQTQYTKVAPSKNQDNNLHKIFNRCYLLLYLRQDRKPSPPQPPATARTQSPAFTNAEVTFQLPIAIYASARFPTS